MRIVPVTEIGSRRPLCVTTIRIAAGMKTYEAQRQASKRERFNVPIDQCMNRADFIVDGAPTCRQHAQQAALADAIARYSKAIGTPPPCGCKSICAGDRCPYQADGV